MENLNTTAPSLLETPMSVPFILTLDMAGNPHQWINHEDAAYYYAKGLVAWDFGESCTLHGGTSRITQQQSTLNMSSIIAIKGKMLKAEQMQRYNKPTLTNKSLFGRDRHLCAYCGDVFTEAELTRDHVVPTSKNGVNDWNNCVSSCKRCNNSKGDRTPEQWGTHLLYLPYTPCRSEYLILTNRRIVHDQMEFLLKRVNKHSRLLS